MSNKKQNNITPKAFTPFGFSVEAIPGINAKALFKFDSSDIFLEDAKDEPLPITDNVSVMPWGADNQMPSKILGYFEEDETLAACQMFNSEISYAGGLRYEIPESSDLNGSVKNLPEVEEFFLNNDIPSYFLGTCKDLKYFEFSVTVLIFSKDFKKIVEIRRKPSASCRFPKADETGRIKEVYFANWEKSALTDKDIETIPLVDPHRAMSSIREFAETKVPKIAFVTKIPGVRNLYYPIPTYGSLFKGKWYNIKKYIGIAKEAKLKNSSPIKYLIEISNKYWDTLFLSEKITDQKKQQERVAQAKQEILDFLTGAENSGKALFANYLCSPDGKEIHDVKITKIENAPEGGDWASDHQEAINMLCFALRVHSNLVGSVPGKAQSNNSGSDKRELYTIAQAMQRAYHDIIFRLHRLIIAFNEWAPLAPVIPYIQLTTLDSHKDFTQVNNDQ